MTWVMSLVQLVDGSIVIGKKVIFVPQGSELPASGKQLMLLAEQGDEMRYDDRPNMIDFAGAYDVDGVGVSAFADAQGVLSYVVTIKGKHVVLVQSKAFLGYDDLPDEVAQWVFVYSALIKDWKQMDFGGKWLDAESGEAGEETED